MALKPRIIYLVKYLCRKTEHKTQRSFSQRQKILNCLWSKKFELQKCGNTGQLLRSHYRNYGEHKGLAVLNSELSKLSP